MAGSLSPQIEKFMEISGAVLVAIHQPLLDSLNKLVEDYQSGEGQDTALAQTAAAVSPDSVDIKDWLARNPYNNPAQLKEAIKASAERGWLTLDEKTFTASQKAQDFNNAIVQLLTENLAEREKELEEIPHAVEMLGRLVEAAHALQGFDKFTLTFSRNFEYEDKTPSLLWVRRHLTSLGSYRDDCHIASWQGGEFSGFAWETLTFIWQDNAHSAEELAEALAFRGYTAEDYQAALDDLQRRGLVALEEDNFQLTEKGTGLRQQAEDKTNQLYQAAFEAISESELDELNGLLAGFAEALKVEEEESASA